MRKQGIQLAIVEASRLPDHWPSYCLITPRHGWSTLPEKENSPVKNLTLYEYPTSPEPWLRAISEKMNLKQNQPRIEQRLGLDGPLIRYSSRSQPRADSSTLNFIASNARHYRNIDSEDRRERIKARNLIRGEESRHRQEHAPHLLSTHTQRSTIIKP